MKFVFHLGLEDVMTLIVLALIVGMIALCWVMLGIENLKTKFKNWKKRTFKKGSDKDATDNGELKGSSNESSNPK